MEHIRNTANHNMRQIDHSRVPNQDRLFDMAPAEVRRVSGRKAVITPGQVMQAFNAEFLDADKCRRWVLERIHVEGPACPYCNAVIVEGGRLQRFWSGKRLVCPACYRFFAATTGTFLAGSHMDFRQVFVTLMLLALKQNNSEIAAAVGCNPETIRLWRMRLNLLQEFENVKIKAK